MLCCGWKWKKNARAVHVYKKSGFEFFEYKEMKKE